MKDKSFPGRYVFDFFKACNILYSNHTTFLKFLNEVVEYCDRNSLNGNAMAGKLRFFSDLITKAFTGTDELQCQARSANYRCHISEMKGERAKRAILDEDENTREESREMATDGYIQTLNYHYSTLFL